MLGLHSGHPGSSTCAARRDPTSSWQCVMARCLGNRAFRSSREKHTCGWWTLMFGSAHDHEMKTMSTFCQTGESCQHRTLCWTITCGVRRDGSHMHRFVGWFRAAIGKIRVQRDAEAAATEIVSHSSAETPSTEISEKHTNNTPPVWPHGTWKAAQATPDHSVRRDHRKGKKRNGPVHISIKRQRQAEMTL